jgi:hypothetical protein
MILIAGWFTHKNCQWYDAIYQSVNNGKLFKVLKDGQYLWTIGNSARLRINQSKDWFMHENLIRFTASIVVSLLFRVSSFAREFLLCRRQANGRAHSLGTYGDLPLN